MDEVGRLLESVIPRRYADNVDVRKLSLKLPVILSPNQFQFKVNDT